MRIAIFVTVVGGETAVVLKILARTLDAVAKAATLGIVQLGGRRIPTVLLP
jgi:hypothetical protein